MLTLYCKDKTVYNVDNAEVLNKDLLPGIMQKNSCDDTFQKWMQSRYSSNTNSDARNLKGLTFGQGRRDRINIQTKAFSLSDCYWIKDSTDSTTFRSMSPYLNKFWFDKNIEYNNEAIPTLYVDGYLDKYWESAQTLCKKFVGAELECIRTLMALGDVFCCTAENKHNGYIEVQNFTTADIMFEPASISGKISVNQFTNEDMLDILGTVGLDMIIVDAIFGNGDRHAGNFGFLRDSNTGEYLSAAPIFDFDHALDSRKPAMDVLIKDLLETISKDSKRKERAIDLSTRIAVVTGSLEIATRSDYIKNLLQ